jgi:hypothetical protein
MPVPPSACSIDQGGPILEFVRVGRLVRVSALDPVSLIEVVAYGPATASEAALQRVALAKLRRAIERAPGRG